mgnify:CR=1 FL=1
MDHLMTASEQISLFCRLNTHTKRDLPIRSSEMGMLIYLVKTQGEKTPNAVAQFFKVTKSMATNMVSALLAKGYIEKQRSKTDKRSPLPKPFSWWMKHTWIILSRWRIYKRKWVRTNLLS